MKFSAEDFKHLYAEMPDEELRSLVRTELNDLARQCYDAEMARRGLSPPGARRPVPPAAVPEEPEPLVRGPIHPLDDAAVEEVDAEADEDLAAAAVFNSREEAKAARAKLQSAALPAFLEDDTVAGGGFRLLVAASYVDQARQVLAENQDR
ncbi:MAG: hypothetical protein ACLP59_03685 [Bryobacteraceae bacterium]